MAEAAIAVALIGGCAGVAETSLTPTTWCDGFEAERLSPVARMSGRNRERLEAAQRLVAPSVAEGRAISGLSLLGGYQEELERRRPDTTTAAAYLAAASGVSVSYEMVAQANGLLCVSTSRARARAIAEAAAAYQGEMLEAARR